MDLSPSIKPPIRRCPACQSTLPRSPIAPTAMSLNPRRKVFAASPGGGEVTAQERDEHLNGGDHDGTDGLSEPTSENLREVADEPHQGGDERHQPDEELRAELRQNRDQRAECDEQLAKNPANFDQAGPEFGEQVAGQLDAHGELPRQPICHIL
jgi:hypothetical protein